MALRGSSRSMGSNLSPPSLWYLVGWMYMGSHEPVRMLWCRWFIHIVSSKSASRKTCECPLSHLRRWTGRPVDGKAVSLTPDPCVLHAHMSLRKILNQKQPPRLHYWCEKVQTFYLHSGQKTLCGSKSCEYKSLDWLQTGSTGYWGNAVPFTAIVLSIWITHGEIDPGCPPWL